MTYDLWKVADGELTVLREEYGLGSGEYHADAYGEQVTYRNRWAAVRIRLNYREARVAVSLFQLREEPLPVYWDLDARKRDPLNGFDLDDLIALRAPTRAVTQRGHAPVAPADVRHAMQEYAGALRAYAGDVLGGDFSVFRELSSVVARRIETFARLGHPLGPETEYFLRAYRELDQH